MFSNKIFINKHIDLIRETKIAMDRVAKIKLNHLSNIEKIMCISICELDHLTDSVAAIMVGNNKEDCVQTMSGTLEIIEKLIKDKINHIKENKQ